MKVELHKTFKKKYKKLRKQEQGKTDKKLSLFGINPFNPTLSNHPLHGKYLGYNSINITGNLRAVFKALNENAVIFVDIDTHSNLYS